jgi:phosphoglycolate phosphatase-like HAD superfamily hydrolase
LEVSPASNALAFLFWRHSVLKAVIFDIDGTLVDSVDIHAMAWQEALRAFGFDAKYEAVRAQIGKGGDKLIPEFVPEDQLQSVQDKLSKHRGELFMSKYMPRIRPLSCVPDLFQRIRDEGLRITLASSAKANELAEYVKLAGIGDFVEKETSKDEVEESKPSPDVFQTALHKLHGVNADEAVVIGDTPHDAIAARRAGLRCIGVLTGGWLAEELLDAGCFVVYRSAAELLALFDESPLASQEAAASGPRGSGGTA